MSEPEDRTIEASYRSVDPTRQLPAQRHRTEQINLPPPTPNTPPPNDPMNERQRIVYIDRPVYVPVRPEPQRPLYKSPWLWAAIVISLLGCLWCVIQGLPLLLGP